MTLNNFAMFCDKTDFFTVIIYIRVKLGMKSAGGVLLKHTKSVKSTLQEDKRNMIMTVTEELRQEGVKEGRKDAQVQNAKAMLNDNVPVEKVAMYSWLAISEVEKIIASHG